MLSSDFRHSLRLVLDLALRDYQQQYQGTYLGFIWMFLQPLLFIGTLYFIFTLGLRAQSTVDMPFSLYLVSGMVCWLYFSSNLSSIAGVVKAYGFLVKKVDVDLSILPAVKVVSSLVAHLFLIGIAVALAWSQGITPSWATLQVFYYLLGMILLLIGLGWITSSTSIFVKDIGNVVSVLVQFGFWLTPIFWNIAMLPEKYHWLIELNPVYYLVSGYRNSIVLQLPFWEEPGHLAYFWLVTCSTLFLGYRVFKRLRPHFAEVM